jgi:hypothetical protein
MFCFNICVEYVATLYAGELYQLIIGRMDIRVLCSFVRAWRLSV